MKIIKNIRQTINIHDLVRPGDKILVGVSGGPDSVCLLYILNKLKHELGIAILVAHVNHDLRKSADGDQSHVEKLCSSLNIPCCSLKIKINKKLQKGSLEEIARDKRLESLISLAKKKKADKIALAHHQDDLAETVLMRIIRGSGLMGLGGILPKRKINGFTVIRPLIEVKRGEILTFLKTQKIKYRTDPTNRNTKFFRNKIRLELLPLLKKEYNKNITEVLSSLSKTSSADYDLLEMQAKKHLKKIANKSSSKKGVQVSLPGLTKLHNSLQRLIIRSVVSELKGNTKGITLTHIIEIEDLIKNRPNNSIVDLPYKISAQKTPKSLIFRYLRKA